MFDVQNEREHEDDILCRVRQYACGGDGIVRYAIVERPDGTLARVDAEHLDGPLKVVKA